MALVAAGWVVSIELRRDKKAQRDKHAEQARLIAVWTDPAEEYWVTLRNGSSLPVYEVEVDIVSVSETYQDLFEQTKRRHGQYTAHLDVLPPGDTRVSEVKGTRRKPIDTPASKPYHLQLGFTDARGSRWTRENQRLIQLLKDRTEIVVDE